MKVRTGFVTNSSSTSFCIVGEAFDEDEINEWARESVEAIAAVYKKKTGKKIDVDTFIEQELSYDLGEYIGLDVFFDCDNRTYYIGLDISQMNDDETLGEFKEKVKNIMQAVGLKLQGLSIIAETIQS